MYVDKSTIPNAGLGLFASSIITKNSIIAEFTGKIYTNNADINIYDTRSNIMFNDGYIMVCCDMDLASYANDAIIFPENRRCLMKALESHQPFYDLHQNCIINAAIILDNKLHKAYLTAKHDIHKNQEIFVHYGFSYWFHKEITTLGFNYESEIDLYGFPKNIHEYPAFLSYMKTFYGDYSYHHVSQYINHHKITIYHGDSTTLLYLKDYSQSIRLKKNHEYDINSQMNIT